MLRVEHGGCVESGQRGSADWIFAAALALVLALGIGLRIANLGNVARRTPDI